MTLLFLFVFAPYTIIKYRHFAANHSPGTKPPFWRARVTPGQDKQMRFQCDPYSLAWRFCTTWITSCEDPIAVLVSLYIILISFFHGGSCFLHVYFRLWSSTKTACQLREPLANKTTGKRWNYPTWKVIPEPGSADRQVGGEPSPHVTAWFPGFSVRFEASPILKDWNWVIRPDEAVESRAPLESDPSLIQWWRLFFN